RDDRESREHRAPSAQDGQRGGARHRRILPDAGRSRSVVPPPITCCETGLQPGTSFFLSKDGPMRLITSSLRTQLFAAFAAVIVVFGIGVVVSISSLSGVSTTLQNGTQRVNMSDTLSKDTYNMQGSQLMATLNNGASAADHA